MDPKYLYDKPEEFRLMIWDIMEDIQDEFWFWWIGWNGFIIMPYFPNQMELNMAKALTTHCKNCKLKKLLEKAQICIWGKSKKKKVLYKPKGKKMLKCRLIEKGASK